MKTLEYIGPKADGERHMREHTNIEWFPGDRHDVSDAHAEELLKHPTSWQHVPAKLASAPKATVKDADPDPVLPAWVSKGMALGATDFQLQNISEAGGPDTEAGAAAWKDATGTDWKPDAHAGTSKSQVKRVATQKAAAKKPAAKKAK